jgi:hypothetical protein
MNYALTVLKDALEAKQKQYLNVSIGGTEFLTQRAIIIGLEIEDLERAISMMEA